MPIHRDRSHLYLGIMPYHMMRPPLTSTTKLPTRASYLTSPPIYGTKLPTREKYIVDQQARRTILPNDSDTHHKQDRQTDRFLFDDEYY